MFVQVVDPSRLSHLPMRGVEEDADAESIRRHEFDRGSDRGPAHREETVLRIQPRPRDQMFIRDGNAEILRLVTRGRVEEEEPRLNQPDTRPYTVVEGVENAEKQEEEGKEIIMQRFIEDQKKSTENNGEEEEEEQVKLGDSQEKKDNTESDHLLQRLMDIPQRNLSTGDVNRLTTLQRDLLLTRFLVEEQRRNFGNVQALDETQSLPGMVPSLTTMATQTDVNRGTQTEILYTMRPPRRKTKSDLDDSGESDTETSYDTKGKLVRNCHKNRKKRYKNLEVPERGRSLSRCEIKTPILEETESALENQVDYSQPHYSKGISTQSGFAATKSSMLRLQMTRKKLQGEANAVEAGSSNHLIGSKKRSCSAQNLPLVTSFAIGAVQDLEKRARARSLQTTPVAQRRDIKQLQKHIRQEFTSQGDEDSEEELGEILNRSKSSHSTRNASTSPIQTYTRRRSSSPDGKKDSPEKLSKSVSTSSDGRKTPFKSRYMEWYKTKKDERDRQRAEEKEQERQKKMKPVKPPTFRLSRRDTPPRGSEERKDHKTPDLKSVQSKVMKKQTALKQSVVSVFQENSKSNEDAREESPKRKVNVVDQQRVFEDDRDSGIAMLAPGSQKMKRKHQNLLDKKSVFTIAYDDMQTKQLRLDSATPP